MFSLFTRVVLRYLNRDIFFRHFHDKFWMFFANYKQPDFYLHLLFLHMYVNLTSKITLEVVSRGFPAISTGIVAAYRIDIVYDPSNYFEIDLRTLRRFIEKPSAYGIRRKRTRLYRTSFLILKSSVDSLVLSLTVGWCRYKLLMSFPAAPAYWKHFINRSCWKLPIKGHEDVSNRTQTYY